MIKHIVCFDVHSLSICAMRYVLGVRGRSIATYYCICYNIVYFPSQKQVTIWDGNLFDSQQ